ncbi:MAG: signal peptide peptidase SppA [Flavobacteriales bacterium]|nr:signal peptide peptidase SppA [Bacteroidota bacterium]MCB9241476.1 signal peptide peptidase SppA [Flavobacteriales bacterium]
MKQFLKFVLATITGIFILFAIFFLVILSLAGGMSKDKKAVIDSNSVLVVSLNYPMPERTNSSPFEAFAAGLSGDMTRPIGMYDVIQSIEHAKTDDKISGIFLDLTFVDAGYARLSEIRNALEDFKSSGKFIYAYGELYYNQTYYLASVADSVFLNPKGNMLFNGMAAEVTFLKETLAKLGIEMQVIKHGKFKGAVEPFTRDELSEANRHQINEYINSLFSQYVSTVGKSRNLTPDELKAMADSLSVTNPKQALAGKMVDELAYRDQVISHIKSRMGLGEDDDINYVKLAKYFAAGGVRSEDSHDSKIAVVYADGDIVSGNGEANEVGSDRFLKALRAAREDDDVKAVVLRVNSPGGSALASEVIWREAILTKAKKPLIVSMGDVAASGGYYISCMADTIVAMPNTITGSIGVFGMYPNASGLYDKLGLKTDYVKTSEYADFGRIDRPLNAGEMAMLTQFVEEIYTDFVGHVSEGRELTTQFIDSVAQGRVWTGEMAKENGLVDVHGGLNDAIKIAAFKAGIDSYDLQSYPNVKDPFAEFFESFGMASIKQKVIKQELGENYSIYQRLKKLQSMTGVQAVMPFSIGVN